MLSKTQCFFDHSTHIFHILNTFHLFSHRWLFMNFVFSKLPKVFYKWIEFTKNKTFSHFGIIFKFMRAWFIPVFTDWLTEGIVFPERCISGLLLRNPLWIKKKWKLIIVCMYIKKKLFQKWEYVKKKLYLQTMKSKKIKA